MATSDKKSSAFVLTKEGKSSIFKQNDGITLNLTRFALFQDKNEKLKRLLESTDYDYTILESLKYDFFDDDNFNLTKYDDALKPSYRKENGESVLCLNVDIFNKNVKEDETYDGIIYFCDAYKTTENGIDDLYETQNPNTLYAIQYFAANKITILAKQDSRIKFVMQLRFTQNNYEVIDLNIPDDIDNGLRIYNNALSNLSLRSKTVGTNRSLTVGNNPNEITSMLDVYADAGSNHARLISLNNSDDLTSIENEVDVKFSEDAFVISGTNVSSVELFSKENTVSPYASQTTNLTGLFVFSDNNEIDDARDKVTLLNSDNNKTLEGINTTFINSNNNEVVGMNNTLIGSNEIFQCYNNDTFIASNSITGRNSENHNTIIGESNDVLNKVSNLVALGGSNSEFINIENGLVIGHDLSIGTNEEKLSDIVVFGKYNAPIDQHDIFVLANGTTDKGNNIFKVNDQAEITINDGTNETVITPRGISHNGSTISFDAIEQTVNNQDTIKDMNEQLDQLEEAILGVVNNGLTNKSFILDVDSTFNVDEHIPSEEKLNNLMVTLYNPFENEVTVTYRYKQKTAMFNPQTETLIVNNKSTIQLVYIDNDDYKGFAKVR